MKQQYCVFFRQVPAVFFFSALIAAVLVFPAASIAQPDPATSQEAEAAKTVSRAYFKKYFVGDPSSAQLLGSETDFAAYEDEMARRKEMIGQLGIKDIDWSALPYNIRMLDGNEAVIMAVGSIEVKTENGSKTKDIQRVFKLVREGGSWKIADSYYGDYRDEETSSFSEEKLKRIEAQIAKDRLKRYESMYTGVRQAYDPEKAPASADAPAPKAGTKQ